ncbi:YggT family protein [Larsenimonas rhizosphaerae]|uniref:YggT family protein n=1 Tax=Larsenimonas rhizosphaerae TaxID=2944682 RepID=A0AA41ZHY0_9GAMM|nr:YggT family protein [Larsenimonas rhizosphaerae]MCM2131586.1 YggT family protein [Larsenimonas rhizosphaerae]MCX2525087.1 YggT family protein [Larsenimonas rhizosphaerae]
MGTTLGNTGLMLVNTLIGVYMFVLMLRFLLHFSKADYFNPISQGVVKATSPLVNPLQKIIRPIGGIDIATLVVGLIFKALGIILVLWIAGAGMPALPSLLIGALAGVLNAILKIYFFAMIILIILSWVAPQANHPGALLVFQITEPVMAPLRRVIPPLGPLDLSPIVLFLIINLLDSLVVNALARAAGYPVGALIGF